LSFCSRCASDTIRSTFRSSVPRCSGRSTRQSSAPALISDSIVRLLIACRSTRLMKSSTVANGPPSSRACTMLSAAAPPTFFTVLSPKRMIGGSAEVSSSKFTPLLLMSGVFTSISSRMHSATACATRSCTPALESTAVMYSCG
jgi:hypothetical protein